MSDEYLDALKGKQITQLRIDYGFTILCEDMLIQVENDFTFVEGDNNTQIYLVAPENLAPIIPILHGTITEVSINNSILSISIQKKNSNIAEIIVQPDENFEAWNIHSNGWYIICMPSGEIAIFPPTNT